MSDENLKNGRVIIPYGRSIMALVAAHSLGKKGVEIIGCDSLDLTVLSFSKYVKDYFIYPDPKDDENAFIEAMLEKVKEYAPGDDRPYVLMPIFRDTKIFAAHKDKFSPYIKIAAPEYEAIKKVHPKQNFARTAKELGISAPNTWIPESEKELEETAKNLDYPVLIKPYDQVGGRGIQKINNFGELKKSWKENKNKYKQHSLIQELKDGKDYCLTALYDHGERKASMAYRNLHRFPANDSGAGIMRETVQSQRFEIVADKLMRKLNWNGIVEFDFLWDEKEDSDAYMLEVNTRFWGGLFQSVESGIDFPWYLYKLTVCGTIEHAEKSIIGTRTKMPYVWLISAFKDVMRDEERTKEIEAKGKEALAHFNEGQLLEGIKQYADYLSDYWSETLNMSKKARKLKTTLEEGSAARNEFLNNEDPKTAFGILFVLGSLIRRGKLPEELSH